MRRSIAVGSVDIAIERSTSHVKCGFPYLGQFYVDLVRVTWGKMRKGIPSSRYGTVALPPPLSRKVTKHVPASIIDPRVGQLAAARGVV